MRYNDAIKTTKIIELLPMHTKMTERELVSLLDEAQEDAAQYNGEFSELNTKYLSAYLGEKTGEFSNLIPITKLRLKKPKKRPDMLTG